MYRDARIAEAEIFLFKETLQVLNCSVFENSRIGDRSVGVGAFLNLSILRQVGLAPKCTFVFQKAVCHLCCTDVLFRAAGHVWM